MVIGNSAAGLSAIEAYRKIDKSSDITLISKEGGNAYSRVLLPYVLRGKLAYENMTIRDDKYYKDMNINYIEGDVTELNNKDKLVTVGNKLIEYDKLLIATGSNPVKPPIPGIDQYGIFHMWTKKDVDGLTPYYKSGKKVLVIGSGFVALQAAWAAVVKGLDVTVVELAGRIMPSVLDEEGGKILHEQILEKGVDLRVNTITERIEKKEDGTFEVFFKDCESLNVDFIIVGTGVRANTAFLKETDIEVDRGILVDRYMRTNDDDVYSAGDVAQGYTSFDEGQVIHALWPTAVEMGKIAGKNMAGLNSEYEGSLNMNVTQMYDLTVASIGRFSHDLVTKSYVFPNDLRGYLKVCYENELVVGACLVGSSDAVKVLGKLRPIIRKKIVADVTPEKLEMYLQVRAFSSRRQI
ncbi:MAG: FAD-dependent oxidoreductase [Firmicutes bacterium]|nr:FAD-dependent oxidoreductase [Bacillota bacterium]